MAVIRLRLLGNFQVEINGSPVILARRKSESLLAYLALQPGEHTREKIAGLLWSDSSETDARRSLRVMLTDIRNKLGDDVLIASRDTLGLNPAHLAETDIQAFSRLLHSLETASSFEIASALELYRGDLLENIYEEWIETPRRKYRFQMLAALAAIIERLRAQGEYARASDHAERLLSLDPYNEKAVQHLLFCLTANGDKERAIKRFKEIQKQGEIEFSRETLALYKNIQSETSPSARLTNLPRPLTSFIGREDELNEVETLITQHRLITLLGVGGSGKTRLAIQAADEISHQYQGGVWWVDLSSLSEPNLVAQSFARVLGVKEQANQDILLLTADHIAELPMLIVLDNCEHLLTASAHCVKVLLERCPQLTVLATSRETLGLESECGWQVPTFPLPEANSNPKQLQKNEAVRLFLDRGRSANNSFQLTEKNASHIAHICRRLDGIPLALELAAALLRSLPVEEVSRRLDQRFSALHITDETRLPRQQTLRALVDWSYNLLTTTEQIFFRRLSVFAGGWTFDAAVIVAGGYEAQTMQKTFTMDESPAALPINPADIVLGLLDSLRRRSLISATYRADGSRYVMLETLREYALERLAESHEENAARMRHMNYMLAFAREADSHLQGKADTAQWAERLQLELDNVRAALSWAIYNGDTEQGMMLATAMSRFWGTHGSSREGRAWLKQLVDHPHVQAHTLTRACLLIQYARSLRTTNDVIKAYPFIEQAIIIFKKLKDESGLAYARFTQGDIFIYAGNIQAALAPLQEALSYYRGKENETFHYVNVLSSLGRAALANRDFAQAYKYIEESSAISQTQGNMNMFAWNKLVLGDIAYFQNNLAQARENYEASVELYIQLKRPGNLAYLYEALASLAYWRGELDDAITLLEKCFACYQQVNSFSTAFSQGYRASIAQAQGDLESTVHWLRTAATPLSEIDDIYRAVYMVKLADYAAAQSDLASAAILYAAALRLTSDPSTVLFPPDHLHAETKLESIRGTMNEADFQSALVRAETLTIQGAVQLMFHDIS